VPLGCVHTSYRRDVTAANWLLLFHLLGAFVFFAGAALVLTLQLGATRREHPSEILALLRLSPAGVALDGIGGLMTLGFGIALANNLGLGFSQAWLQAAFALWIVKMAVGGIGNRNGRRARELAERLAGDGDRPSEELRALVRARPALWAGYLGVLLLVAIVVLMVWRPA
jgi:uncharacterized membrane protein